MGIKFIKKGSFLLSRESKLLCKVEELPANTLRFRFSQSTTNPTSITNGGTWTKVVNSEFNDWDWTCTDTDWSRKFSSKNGYALNTKLDPVIKIIAAGDTSSVTNTSDMFIDGDALTEVEPFDTKNVTNMSHMFFYCSSLTEVPLFDTSSVTIMNSMFYGCTSLTEVPLFNTSNVTNMNSMFSRCSSLTEVPLFDTSSVTIMNSMFSSCYLLTTVPLFDTSSVTSMSAMFTGCSSLTTVPLFDTKNVTDMTDMFYQCFSLTTVPLFDTSSVTYMTDMFRYCYNVQSGAFALYQAANTTGKVTGHKNTFLDCGRDTTAGLAELNQIPTDWGGLKAS